MSKRYEYRVERSPAITLPELEDWLEKYDEDGWELVCQTQHRIVGDDPSYRANRWVFRRPYSAERAAEREGPADA